MNTQALRNYSPAMRALIQSHVEAAVVFVQEMVIDDPVEYEDYTIKMLRETVAAVAVDFVAQDFDPDGGDTDLIPAEMQAAIGEFVKDNFTVSFKLG